MLLSIACSFVSDGRRSSAAGRTTTLGEAGSAAGEDRQPIATRQAISGAVAVNGRLHDEEERDAIGISGMM
jgi:hypothetical protein